MDILHYLRAGATDPARPFLRSLDGSAVDYRQTHALSGKMANALSTWGVRKGDRVAVQVTKSRAALYLYLACLRLGAVFLPLNPAYTVGETNYFLQDAETALYVCDPAQFNRMKGQLRFGRMMTMDELVAASARTSADFTDPLFAPSELAAILYTSGTTGRSKGVMLSRQNLSSNAETLAQVWAFGPQDVLLHALPIFHTHGLFVATNTVLVAGASMIFLPDFTPDGIFSALPRANVMMGVPTYYTRLLSDPRLTRAATSDIRLFISGSAPLSAVTHRDWQDRTGHAILERYGMTETNMNTSNPVDGPRKPGTVGLPLPGVAVQVCDPATGVLLPPGHVGGVEVKGPNVFAGYWRAPEKTAAEFRADGFFITGDMGVFDADGYLSIVGRSRDMIITGGLNVYPAEVESALDDLPGIAASAVIGTPHPDFGEGVVAIVVPQPGVTVTETALRDQMRDRLAAYKIPKRIIIADDLPRNAMGKVQKNSLRDQWADLFSDRKDTIPD